MVCQSVWYQHWAGLAAGHQTKHLMTKRPCWILFEELKQNCIGVMERDCYWEGQRNSDPRIASYQLTELKMTGRNGSPQSQTSFYYCFEFPESLCQIRTTSRKKGEKCEFQEDIRNRPSWISKDSIVALFAGEVEVWNGIWQKVSIWINFLSSSTSRWAWEMKDMLMPFNIAISFHLKEYY